MPELSPAVPRRRKPTSTVTAATVEISSGEEEDLGEDGSTPQKAIPVYSAPKKYVYASGVAIAGA